MQARWLPARRRCVWVWAQVPPQALFLQVLPWAYPPVSLRGLPRGFPRVFPSVFPQVPLPVFPPVWLSVPECPSAPEYLWVPGYL